MKTLVIHPDDPSTDFLIFIYDNIDCDVLYEDVTEHDVTRWIPEYDRIIMLGHGCPDGLFGDYGLVVNESHVELLRDKELVCIWCNADQFMDEYKLNGFYSGMFISEVGEAQMYDIKVSQEGVTNSNNMFATLLGKNLDNPERLSIMKEHYKLRGSLVTEFNRERLYERR